MKSGNTESRTRLTDSPKVPDPQWKRVEVMPSPEEVSTVGLSGQADGWSRARIRGDSDSVKIVYRYADARREAVRKRLREVLCA